MGRQREDRPVAKKDIPLVRGVEPAQAVEQRGLAGTVWADQADDLPCRDIEGYAVEREDADKANDDTPHRQKRFRQPHVSASSTETPRRNSASRRTVETAVS